MDYTLKDEEEGKEIRFSNLEEVDRIVIEIIDPELDPVYTNHIEISKKDFTKLIKLLVPPGELR